MPLLLDENALPAVPVASAAVVKDGSMQTFKTDVAEESKKRTVLAYFTSSAVEKDRFFPLLEKYVNLANGKAVLVRFFVEECQPLAAQLGIRSVPTTMIFAKGALVDGFAGEIPESQLKQVMQALIGKEALSLDELLKKAAETLQSGNADAALGQYAAVLEKDEANPAAFAGMIRCFIKLKQFDAAQDMADGLDASVKSPELDAAKAALKIAIENQNAPAVDQAAEKLKQNPDDLQARFDYAVALFAADKPEAAIDELIAIFKIDCEWNNDAARQELFKIFTSLGNSNPITVAGRRKLSSLLFS